MRSRIGKKDGKKFSRKMFLLGKVSTSIENHNCSFLSVCVHDIKMVEKIGTNVYNSAKIHPSGASDAFVEPNIFGLQFKRSRS